jgi:hypothetical protein
MSQFSAGTKTPPPSTSPPSNSPHRPGHRKTNSGTEPFPDHRVSADISRPNTPPSRPDYGTPLNGGSPIEPSARRRRSSSAASSRPPSMVLAHQPPIMDITEDTIPELQPIFSFLNSHSNKLYQEGYFLKLDDQNTRMLNLAPATALSIPLHQLPPCHPDGSTFYHPTIHTCRDIQLTMHQQRVNPTLIEPGPSALPSSWELSCHYGTPGSSMQPARMARYCPNLST